MVLLIIFLALLIERFGLFAQLRVLTGLKYYFMGLNKILSSIRLYRYPFAWVVLALPLPIALALFVDFVQTGQSLLLLMVLFYCLGPDNLYQQVNAYLNAYVAKDMTKVQQIAEVIVAKTETHISSEQVATVILSQANQRLFAVLFWFICFGVWGALIYRMMQQLDQYLMQSRSGINVMVMEWLDYLPARLVAISYALAGDIEQALSGWHDNLIFATHKTQGLNQSLLISTGKGALNLNVSMAESEQAVAYQVQAALNLICRALVLWLLLLLLVYLVLWAI